MVGGSTREAVVRVQRQQICCHQLLRRRVRLLGIESVRGAYTDVSRIDRGRGRDGIVQHPGRVQAAQAQYRRCARGLLSAEWMLVAEHASSAYSSCIVDNR
jgi:hypothetical protein